MNTHVLPMTLLTSCGMSEEVYYKYHILLFNNIPKYDDILHR